MRTLNGTVTSGFGVACKNLALFYSIIEKRTDLSGLVPGTLNIKLSEPYFVRADATLSKEEYHDIEDILFQRCRIAGIRCLIMRPKTHEQGNAHGPKTVEIMSNCHLRSTLNVTDVSALSVEIEGDDNWWSIST